MTVTNSRTRGRAPEMMGTLSEEVSNHDVRSDEVIEVEDGELYRLEKETAEKSSPNLGMTWAKATLKGGGQGKNRQRMFSLRTCSPHHG